jgi:hypothetical protein
MAMPATLLARADEAIDRLQFAAVHSVAIGTKRTYRD